MAVEGCGERMEIYKLHAELADRVSERRVRTNHTYGGLLAGLGLFLGGLLKIGDGNGYDGVVFCVVGAVGALLAVSWLLVARSYEQLNTGKFQALLELEKELTYSFFEREWHFLGEGKSASHYLKLGKVERAVPWLFLVLYVVVLGFGVFRWVNHP